LRAALSQFVQAKTYADQFGRDVWDFAIDIESLRQAGVTTNDLRWLLYEGYIEHSHERPSRRRGRRVFHRAANLVIDDRSCFVLTPQGLQRTRAIHGPAARNGPGRAVTSRTDRVKAGPAAHPYWDARGHTLYWAGRLVKHFKADAPYQEAILNAFQVAKWPAVVTVRLLGDSDCFSKDRVRNTIRNLNRVAGPHLAFHQEGNGGRVRWEAL
jgi:hypothetical protein